MEVDMIRVVASMEKKMSVQKATVKELLMQIATLKKKKNRELISHHSITS